MNPIPQKAFDEESQRLWYAIIEMFSPYTVTNPDGSPGIGCQILVAQDIESGCAIGHRVAAHEPRALLAAELLSFADEVFRAHGCPKEGLVIAPSVWWSSAALYQEPTMRDALSSPVEAGVSWIEMQEAERLKVAIAIQQLGIAVDWGDSENPRLAAILGV